MDQILCSYLQIKSSLQRLEVNKSTIKESTTAESCAFNKPGENQIVGREIILGKDQIA